MRPAPIAALLALSLLLGESTAHAQPPKADPKKFDEVAQIKIEVDPPVAKPGQIVTWRLTMTMIPGWRTYPTEQLDPKAASFVNQIRFSDALAALATPGLIPVGKLTVTDPASAKIKTPRDDPDLQGIGVESIHYYLERVVWERPFVVGSLAQPKSALSLKVRVNLQSCDKKCLNYAATLATPVTVGDGPPIDAALLVLVSSLSDAGGFPAIPFPALAPIKDEVGKAAAVKLANPPPTTVAVAPQPSRDGQPAAAGDVDSHQDLDELLQLIDRSPQESSGLLEFMLMGVFWGAVSLITPCVFPMIPITVSFFLKQSEKEHHRPLTMASVYCLTIVVVLTIAAVAFLTFFQWLSQNSIMNFALGALFIYFALSLFGMYEIELPGGLARFTSSREGQGGLAGTMFMALTFTIVSFACVAPFLGGFGGTAASNQFTFLDRVLGGLAFSVTFALPFFVLALFPSLVKKMPKSGSWLNNVKVVMGFLEVAAALKFLRAGELFMNKGEPATFFTYDFVLATYVALCVLCALYLLNVFRLPHDSPEEHLGVMRMMFGFIFLALAFHLIPGLFSNGTAKEKQRPSGTVFAWVDSFLLPEPIPGHKGELDWNRNLRKTVEQARRQLLATGEPQFIFIDWTGVGCTNCKLNEANVFPKVTAQLKRYHRFQGYTDTDDDAGNRYKDFQQKAFDTTELPLYAILQVLPNGRLKVVDQFGGVLDRDGFIGRLEKPFNGQGNGG